MPNQEHSALPNDSENDHDSGDLRRHRITAALAFASTTASSLVLLSFFFADQFDWLRSIATVIITAAIGASIPQKLEKLYDPTEQQKEKYRARVVQQANTPIAWHQAPITWIALFSAVVCTIITYFA